MPSLVAECFNRNVTINLEAEETSVEEPPKIVRKTEQPKPKPRPRKSQPHVEPNWEAMAREIESIKTALDTGMGGKHELERLKELQIIWGRKWGKYC